MSDDTPLLDALRAAVEVILAERDLERATDASSNYESYYYAPEFALIDREKQKVEVWLRDILRDLAGRHPDLD